MRTKKIIDQAILENEKSMRDRNVAGLLSGYAKFKTPLIEDAKRIYVESELYCSMGGYTLEAGVDGRKQVQNEMLKYLSIVNPNSKGVIVNNNMVITFLNKYYGIDDALWKAAYENGDTVGSEPSIGMTHNQVVLSSWGKPQKVNTTKTKGNTQEQWIYSNSKYVYLDNGVVTAIQN